MPQSQQTVSSGRPTTDTQLKTHLSCVQGKEVKHRTGREMNQPTVNMTKKQQWT